MEDNECQSLFDNLDEWLNDESRVITYRSVSLTFSLHVNYAKHVLEEFTKSERGQNRHLSVTYCVTGYVASNGNKIYKVVVVPEEMKEEAEAALLPPVSCHIYSIQNYKLKTADMLYSADFDLLKSAGFDTNRFSAVKCPSARLTARTVTTDVAPVISNSTSQTASTLPSSAPSACNQVKGGDVKKPAEKTTHSKTSVGFSRLFGSAPKKQQPIDDKKASTIDTASRSTDVTQTVSRSPGVGENVMSSKSTPETGRMIETSNREAASSKVASESRMKPADVSKTSNKHLDQVKTKNESSKRRRIVSVSSSDDEDVDNVEPSSPDLIVPSPPTADTVNEQPMDVDTVPVIADTSAEPHRMQRKLVSKTYVNEDGYMVTEKVWENEMVPVGASDDTAKKPSVQPPSAAPPQPKKQPAKKTPPQSSNTKQSSLTKFFQKK